MNVRSARRRDHEGAVSLGDEAVTDGKPLAARDDAGAGDGLEDRILEVIAREGMVERDRLSPEATLEELGIQSVDVVQILMGLEDEFGVYVSVDGPLAQSRNVGELVSALSELIRNHRAAADA